jgi:hypothetical protein
VTWVLGTIEITSCGEYSNCPLGPVAPGFTTVGFGRFRVDLRTHTGVGGVLLFGSVDDVTKGGWTNVLRSKVLLNIDPLICPLGWVLYGSSENEYVYTPGISVDVRPF